MLYQCADGHVCSVHRLAQHSHTLSAEPMLLSAGCQIKQLSTVPLPGGAKAGCKKELLKTPKQQAEERSWCYGFVSSTKQRLCACAIFMQHLLAALRELQRACCMAGSCMLGQCGAFVWEFRGSSCLAGSYNERPCRSITLQEPWADFAAHSCMGLICKLGHDLCHVLAFLALRALYGLKGGGSRVCFL